MKEIHRKTKKLEKELTIRLIDLHRTSPLFKILNPSDYNLNDYDTGTFPHSHKELQELFDKLYKIKEATQSRSRLAFGCINEPGKILITTYDTNKNKLEETFEFGYLVTSIIEYTFGTKFHANPLPIPTISDRSFKARKDIVLHKNREEDPSLSTLFKNSYVRPEGISETSFHVENLNAFKAGISHLKHLVDRTSDFHWLSSENGVEQGGRYKHLHYMDEDILCFELFDLRLYGEIPFHCFYLNCESIPEILTYYDDLEDEQLLVKFKSFYRGYKISEFVEAI